MKKDRIHVKKTVLTDIDDLLKKIWQKLLISLPFGNAQLEDRQQSRELVSHM